VKLLRLKFIYKRLSERVPENKRKQILVKMDYGGIKEDIDEYTGKRFFLALLFGLIGLLIPLSLGKLIGLEEILLTFVFGLVLGIIFFCLTLLLYYLHLEYQIEDRAKRVESVLPDFLLLVASNLKSGMTPFNATKNSCREEFGPLAEEMKVITTRSLGVESFRETLKMLSEKIDSRILKETVSFLSESIRSGGKLAKLIEASAEDISQTQELKKELISGTKMYVMFVLFVIVVATPLLMSISVQFLEMITSIQTGQPAIDGTTKLGFLSSQLSITPDFMQNISFILLLGNALLSSLFIGVLTERKAKLGIKYAPIIFIASAVLFIGFKTMVSGIISVA